MLWTSPAFGVRPPAAEHRVPEHLTIDEAVAYALRHNPDLRAFRATLGLAEADVLSATLLADPGIGAAYLRERERAEGETDTTRGYGFGVAQSIGVAGQRLARTRLARAARDRVEHEIIEAEHRLARDVKVAAFNLFFENVDSELDRVFTEMAEDLRASISADAPASESLRAENDFRLHEITDVDDVQVNRARYELALLLGFPPTAFIAIEERPPVPGIEFLDYTVVKPNVRLSVGDLTELIPIQTEFEEPEDGLFDAVHELFDRDHRSGIEADGSVLSSRLAVFRRAIREARLALDLSHRRKIPDLELFFDYERAESGSDTLRAIAAGGATELPVFDRNRGGVARALAELEISERELNAAKAEVLRDIVIFLLDLENTYRIHHLSQRETAERFPAALRMTIEDYRAGRADLEAVLGLRWRYRDFLTFYFEVLTTYHQGRAHLDYLMGAAEFLPIENDLGGASSPLGKLASALTGLVIVPLELPASIAVAARREGLLWGCLTGPLQGVVAMGERLGAALLDVATFAVPYPLPGYRAVSDPASLAQPWQSTFALQIEAAEGGKVVGASSGAVRQYAADGPRSIQQVP